MATIDIIDAQVISDEQAVVDHALTGKPLDPAVAARVRDRAARIRDEIRNRHGILDIAVDLIRAGRDEE